MLSQAEMGGSSSSFRERGGREEEEARRGKQGIVGYGGTDRWYA